MSGIGVGLARQSDGRGQDALGVEARIRSESKQEAPDHEDRPDQEDERQPELRNHQDPTQAAARSAGHGSRALLERIDHVDLAGLQNRREAHHERAQRGDGHDEGHRPPVQIVGDPEGRTHGRQAHEPRHAVGGEREADPGSGRDQQQGFGQGPAQKLPPPGAEREAHGVLLPLGRSPGEHQVGHVGAGDELNEQPGDQQKAQRRRHPGRRELLEQGYHLGPASPIAVGVLPRERRRDRLDLGSGLLDGNPRAKACDGIQSAHNAILAPGSRPRGVQTSAYSGNAKPGGITPTTVNSFPSTFKVCPSARGSPPKWRRQRSWPSSATGCPPGRSSSGAKTRPSTATFPRRGRQRRRNPRGLHAFGLVFRTEVELGPLEGTGAVERTASGDPVEVVGTRKRFAPACRKALPGRGCAQRHQPVDLGVGQRPEEPRVDRGEEGGTHADAEPHAEDGHGAQAPSAQERAHGVAEVPRQSIHGG